MQQVCWSRPRAAVWWFCLGFSPREGGRNAREGLSVVLHEFAHKLDSLDGFANGEVGARKAGPIIAVDLRSCRGNAICSSPNRDKGRRHYWMSTER
ncbi:MAG: hypothetical protein M2R45_01697 [Verrucomicrobia subdivision 3 bacterium]|nr:hypothetical protein [Limisphaerales bacterium]MCS1413436.1 hypothetical protein [Limisphaerales bacterium]